MEKGVSHGKAFFADKNKTLWVGQYVNGKFTGTGWRLKADGSFTKGTWEDGYPVTVSAMTSADGKPVVLSPKTIPEAINQLNQNFSDRFITLRGEDIIPALSNLADDNDAFDYINNGLLSLPGSVESYIVEGGLVEGDNYISLYLATPDLKKATTKYAELCKAVQSAKISVKPGRTPTLLEGTMEEVPSSNATVISKFYFPGLDDNSDFHICVVLREVKAGDYRVFLAMGNPDLTEAWVENE